MKEDMDMQETWTRVILQMELSVMAAAGTTSGERTMYDLQKTTGIMRVIETETVVEIEMMIGGTVETEIEIEIGKETELETKKEKETEVETERGTTCGMMIARRMTGGEAEHIAAALPVLGAAIAAASFRHSSMILREDGIRVVLAIV